VFVAHDFKKQTKRMLVLVIFITYAERMKTFVYRRQTEGVNDMRIRIKREINRERKKIE
jgi:steroid 5-alpha reductase family enzyme